MAERGGRIGYSVTRRSAPLLDFSTLGFELLDAPALREGLEITGTSRDSRDETWETVWGEQRTVRSHYSPSTQGLPACSGALPPAIAPSSAGTPSLPRSKNS